MIFNSINFGASQGINTRNSSFVRNMSIDLDVSIKMGDILVYNMSMGDEISYQKFILTNESTNMTHKKLIFDRFEAESLHTFNATADNQTEYILSGNITEDLFSNETMVNMVLPLRSNFTEQSDQIQGVFDQIPEEVDIRLNFESRNSGLTLVISAYFRIVVHILIMKMEIYYSSERILLQYNMWMRNFQTDGASEMNITIVPEYSTAKSVNEDPFNPLNISTVNLGENSSIVTETNSSGNVIDGSDQNVLIDGKSILILGGIVGTTVGGGFILRKLIVLRKKKKIV